MKNKMFEVGSIITAVVFFLFVGMGMLFKTSHHKSKFKHQHQIKKVEDKLEQKQRKIEQMEEDKKYDDEVIRVYDQWMTDNYQYPFRPEDMK